MARHRPGPGQRLIDGLIDLGRALGYFTTGEFPVERGGQNPPAVDVAWLKEEGQIFPLMLFEVESRTTNAVANNAVKVFGKSNEEFEKPLFFFHVIVAAGSGTSRIDTLQRLFGSYNYRVYRLQNEEITRLVIDILSQHRRLERSISLIEVVDALSQPAWADVDLHSVVIHIETLEFKGNYLADYAALASRDSRFLSHFLRVIGSTVASRSHSQTYGTYIGDSWGMPLHIAMLALHETKELVPLRELRWWQEESTYMSMIGPHFGLSRDYDDFVLGLAPSLLALIAALMYKVPGAGAYLLDQFRFILHSLDRAPTHQSFFTAIWMTHVAVANDDAGAFEECRSFINDRGGVSLVLLLGPPSSVSFEDAIEDGWFQTVRHEPAEVPLLEAFRMSVRETYGEAEDLDGELTRLGLQALCSNDSIWNWAPSIIRLLHSPSGGTRP